MTATEQSDTLPVYEAALNGCGSMRRILVVDPQAEMHVFFRNLFPPETERLEAEETAGAGYEVDAVFQGKEGWERIRNGIVNGQPYTVAIVDGAKSGAWNGLEATAMILGMDPDVQVICRAPEEGFAFEELRRKAGRTDRFVLLKKPFDGREIQQLVAALAEKWDLARVFRETNHRWRESEQCHLFMAHELERRVADRTAELASTRRRLEHLLRSSPAVIYSFKIAEPPSFTFVSDNFGALFGHKPAELLEKPEFWTSHLHPADAAQAPANQATLLEMGRMDVDFRFRHKDGSYRWVHDTARVIRDENDNPVEVIGSLSDITERKRAEDAWREGENRYRNLIENQGEGVVMTDPSLRFLFANPAAGEIFNLTPKDLVGRPLLDFVSVEDHDRLKAELHQRKGGTKSTHELDLNAVGGVRRRLIVTATPQYNENGEFQGSLAIFRDITERLLAEEKLRLQTTALEAAANGIVITNRQGVIVWVNPAFTRLTGYSAEEAIGQPPSLLKSGAHDKAFYHEMWSTILGGKAWHGEMVNRRKDGSHYCEDMTITPLLDKQGQVENFVAVKQDITERKEAEKELGMMDMQLRQAQKLEAIGQLAAGISHEINTPIQYVGDNTRFLKDAFAEVQKVLRSHQEILAEARDNPLKPETLARAREIVSAADLGYLFEQVPSAINESLEGVDRVSKIVRAMKEFSHPGGKEKSGADINKAIESTITVARNEWKYVAEVKLELDSELPPVPCFLGEFNQVILNLVINAAHAIGDVVKDRPGEKGLITISTRRDGETAEVRVADTGTGIPESARPRIFEPFFTTKAVGKGTGQGLSIVYGSIVKKHGGAVSFETKEGSGTTFILRLPLSTA